MSSFLQSAIEFQRYFGIDLSFDFITGRDYSNKQQNRQITKANTTKDTDKKEIKSDTTNTTAMKREKISTDIETSENYEKKDLMPSEINIDNIKTFEELYKEVKNFNGCDLKKSGAKNTVIYDGNPKAKIMLIGEAPGETEDELGKPFCGESGQLLRKALKFINLNESNLLITNCVFWRPPLNRTPNDEEIKLCLPFIKKMIEIIAPNVIILCGATSTRAITGTKEKISDLVGKISKTTINAFQTSVFPVYHPSYLLRCPNKKKDFWEHLLLLKKELAKMQK